MGHNESELESDAVRCFSCGSDKIERSIKAQQFAYRDGSQEVLLVAQVPVITCATCGETFTDIGAEEAQHEAVCGYLKRLNPREIKALREKRGWSQARLADETGIGIASIKRWESGTVIQNASLDAQLKSVFGSVETAAKSWPTPRFKTPFPPEILEAAEIFKLRRHASAVPEHA